MTQTASPLANIQLTDLASCGGCAAKADSSLVKVLAGLAGAPLDDPSVLVGLDPSDDGAVYQLDDEKALVASVDFFPPLVDDPTEYGGIAASNAVSDIYAMGGKPIFALSISGFPSELDPEIVEAVNGAAAKKMSQCGAVVLGGHSIRCQEPIFGLCVLGFVHPTKIWRKGGARIGDVLVLSKAIGTGVLLSQGAAGGIRTAVDSMIVSNEAAAQALSGHQPTAVTDVTGYGLAGHCAEMAQQSGVRLRLEARDVPLLEGALAAAKSGHGTSADDALRDNPQVSFGTVPSSLAQLMCDPQTSGGLLAAVSPMAVANLEGQGFYPVGSVVSGSAGVEFV